MATIILDTPATLHLLIVIAAVIISAAVGAIASRLLNGVIHKRPQRVTMTVKSGSRQLLRK